MRISVRLPKTLKERRVAAVNSTEEDIYPVDGQLLVTGKNTAGRIIELGYVSQEALYQKGVDALSLINRVRFG